MLPELESNSVLLTLLYALGVVVVFCILGGIVHLILTAMERYRRRADSNSLAARIVATFKGPVALFFAIIGLAVRLRGSRRVRSDDVSPAEGLSRLGHQDLAGDRRAGGELSRVAPAPGSDALVRGSHRRPNRDRPR